MAKRNSVKAHAFLTIRVNSFDVRSSAGINIFLKGTYPDFVSEEERVFISTSHLTIRGECTLPRDRVGQKFEVLVYGQNARRSQLKVEDIHNRDDDRVPVYRMIRGKRVPVFDVPRGIATIERRRDDGVWSAWVPVEPHLITDMLVVLGLARKSFLSIHERKFERRRWIQDFALQTNDPSEE
jgi:hypothetical protein